MPECRCRAMPTNSSCADQWAQAVLSPINLGSENTAQALEQEVPLDEPLMTRPACPANVQVVPRPLMLRRDLQWCAVAGVDLHHRRTGTSRKKAPRPIQEEGLQDLARLRHFRDDCIGQHHRGPRQGQNKLCTLTVHGGSAGVGSVFEKAPEPKQLQTTPCLSLSNPSLLAHPTARNGEGGTAGGEPMGGRHLTHHSTQYLEIRIVCFPCVGWTHCRRDWTDMGRLHFSRPCWW